MSSVHLENIALLLQDYTASCPRRLPSLSFLIQFTGSERCHFETDVFVDFAWHVQFVKCSDWDKERETSILSSQPETVPDRPGAWTWQHTQTWKTLNDCGDSAARRWLKQEQMVYKTGSSGTGGQLTAV
jgi:hypothetical protein